MNCVTCHKELDTDTPIEEGAKPSPGSVAICFYCGQIYVFDDAVRKQPCPDEYLAEVFKNDPVAKRHIQLTQEHIRNRNKQN